MTDYLGFVVSTIAARVYTKTRIEKKGERGISILTFCYVLSTTGAVGAYFLTA